MFTLMAHLQGMGEAHAALGRAGHVSRDALLAAAAVYKGDVHSYTAHCCLPIILLLTELYGDGEDGIVATFQVRTLSQAIHGAY
jgi:hypothetical protein